MSAPLAGKFQDHYITLGVDPGADTETIQIAYLKLIEKYGPENGQTADPDKLEIINGAYETLSDPELRKEFDKIKGVSTDRGKPMFMGVGFFDTLSQSVGLRGAILSILYDRRRTRPFTPALSMRHLEGMLETNIEALNFALWYLKQRGFISPDDKSSLQITANGMDFLEANRPDPEEVMPFIKLAAIVGFQAPKPEAVVAASSQEPSVEESAIEERDDAEIEAELEPQPVSSAPTPVARAIGKLDGNMIRNMASRGLNRR
jgi:curved DNA-binding protein CbpA